MLSNPALPHYIPNFGMQLGFFHPPGDVMQREKNDRYISSKENKDKNFTALEELKLNSYCEKI